MTKACAKKPAATSTKVVKKPCMRKPCAFIPKKGFARMCKRPAQKKPAMADVPYTRSTSKVGKIRRDRIQPKRTILDFTVAQGHKSVIAILKRDGLVRSPRLHDLCSVCGCRLAYDEWHQESRSWSMRCSSRHCRRRVDILGDHPFFHLPGKGALPLSSQSLMLCCFLNKLGTASTHQLTGITGITIQRFFDQVRIHIAKHVTEHQDMIMLGDKEFWSDVEADEVTLSKMDAGVGDKPISWVQYLGIMRRGFPSFSCRCPSGVPHVGLQVQGHC